MADTTYTVDKEINGKKYTAQFIGLGPAMDAIDNSYVEGSNNISLRKISEYVLKHVIVEPSGLTFDDFLDMDELGDVVNFGRDVMQGKFRPPTKSK